MSVNELKFERFRWKFLQKNDDNNKQLNLFGIRPCDHWNILRRFERLSSRTGRSGRRFQVFCSIVTFDIVENFIFLVVYDFQNFRYGSFASCIWAYVVGQLRTGHRYCSLRRFVLVYFYTFRFFHFQFKVPEKDFSNKTLYQSNSKNVKNDQNVIQLNLDLRNPSPSKTKVSLNFFIYLNTCFWELSKTFFKILIKFE